MADEDNLFHEAADYDPEKDIEAKRAILLFNSPTNYICTICNITCYSEEFYQKHLGGRKHRDNVNRINSSGGSTGGDKKKIQPLLTQVGKKITPFVPRQGTNSTPSTEQNGTITTTTPGQKKTPFVPRQGTSSTPSTEQNGTITTTTIPGQKKNSTICSETGD